MKIAWAVAAMMLLLVFQADALFLHGSGSSGGGSTLSLLQMAGGQVGALSNGGSALPIIGNGKFTGSAPASMTATVSGCGGGSLSVITLLTPSYGAGTYQVQLAQPTAAGTGCTITVTDNLGRSATSPTFSTIDLPAGSAVVSQIHNAPGWLPSHAYSPASGPKTRILNGPGWTSGAYVPGALLRAYELTSGSCTSASSGGPTGTSASITDGTCTWKYLSGVDYITVSGWAIDAPVWVSGKTYAYYEFMTIVDGGILKSYLLDGTDANAFCTSTVAPTGTGSPGGFWSTGSQQTADGCFWDYLGDVTYSSQASSMPVQTYSETQGAISHIDRPYTGVIWNDAEYVAGSGGERSPITLFNHVESALGMEATFQVYSGLGAYITLTAATGESFGENLTTSTPLAGYDATKGVALRNSSTTFAPIFAATGLGCGPAGLCVWDGGVVINGLQMKSAAGMGLHMHDTSTVTNNIIDGGWVNDKGGWCTAIYQDSGGILVNNLILSHGCGGMAFKYGNSFALYNTVVNVGSESNTAALLYGLAWTTQNQALANSAIYGYTHVAGELQGVGPDPLNSRGIGNVTDIASPDNTGTTWWINGTPNISNVTAAPGTTFGVSGASMFVSPGSDYRPGTALTNSGTAFGAFYTNCLAIPGSCTPVYQTMDTPDVLGNTRPNGSSQISSGLEQAP